MNSSIPVIDLASFTVLPDINNNLPPFLEESKRETADKLRQVCKESGFFYVKNHDVPAQANILQLAKQFFAIPDDQKEQLAAVKNPLFRGYISKEAGHHTCNAKNAKNLDEKESYTIGAEANTSPMHGDNSWPSDEFTPGLGDTEHWRAQVAAYWESMLQLARAVSRCLAMSLNLEEDYFESALTDPCAQMVLLRYFVDEFDRDQSKMGCGPHTDCGFLTILQSCSRGLQVKTNNQNLTNGQVDFTWVDVPPIEGMFVVNLGDMAQYWSDGLYKSTLHRVLIQPNKTTDSDFIERYSVPFFCNCNFDTPIDVGGLVTANVKNRSIEADRMKNEQHDSLEAKVTSVMTDGEQLTAGVYIMERLGLMRRKNDS